MFFRARAYHQSMSDNPVRETQTCVSPSRPYYFGNAIHEGFPEFLGRHSFDQCFLIGSDHLLRDLGRPLLAAMKRAGIRFQAVSIPDTERDKTWDTLRNLCEQLLARGITKDSILIALGGGVLGNVVGMAAGLIYRGIRFVHVPTTVTAITDSTLSNKQAINGATGKNQFGLYHAPLFVWADASYPLSEPPRQQRSGIVEGIKNVLISHNGPAAAEAMLHLWHQEKLAELMWALIESKQRILRQDPTEKGYAIVLEYGHTFGHAIEWLGAGKLLPGEAVSIGMGLAAELSHRLGHLSEPVVRDHYRLLDRLGTPTHLPRDLDPQAVYQTMLSDNKRTGKGLRLLLLAGYGRFVNPDGDYQVAVQPGVILDVLERSRSRA